MNNGPQNFSPVFSALDHLDPIKEDSVPFCNKCGAQYTFGSPSCNQCGTPLPALPPEVAAGPDTVRQNKNPQIKRIIAGLLDVLIAFLIVSPLFFSKKMLVVLLAKRLIWFLPGIYLLLKDSFGGKSIGKLLTNILVVNELTHSPGNVMDSIKRNLPLVIPIVGPTVFAAIIGIQLILGRKKRLGDDMANTVVLADFDYQKGRHQ